MKKIKTIINSLIIIFLIIFIIYIFFLSARIYLLNDFHLVYDHHRIDNNGSIQTRIADSKDYSDDLLSNNHTALPEEFSIDTPFISQAPLAIWDELHESACEEASLLIFKYWQDNKRNISSQEAENDIQLLVNYEYTIGVGPSISLDNLSTIAADYYNINHLRSKKVNNYQQIMETLLVSDSPLIVGAAGKLLQNPNFRNGGPNYHMLVVIGWDKEYFITNDPGTKNGQNFKYKKDIFYNAIHDWNNENILLGDKNILFSSKDL